MIETPVLIAIAALGGVCLLLFAAIVYLIMKLRALTRDLVLLQGDATGEDFITIVGDHVEATRELDRHTKHLETRVKDLRSTIARSVQNVGVVRYDAFEDMGGHLSFSAAFLDEHGTGVCLTCINGRTDARIYAKGVMQAEDAGVSLSSEEREAVRLAMESEQTEGAPTPQDVAETA